MSYECGSPISQIAGNNANAKRLPLTTHGDLAVKSMFNSVSIGRIWQVVLLSVLDITISFHDKTSAEFPVEKQLPDCAWDLI